MKIFVRALFLVVVIALGLWLWTVFFPGPEKLVRKRIAEVARLASFSTGEGLIKQGLRVQSLAKCFGTKVEVAVNLPGNQHHELAGRDEIAQAATLARQNLSWLKVELLDPNVVLSPDQQSAVVNLTLKVTFPDQKDFVVQEMKFALQKIDGEWLIIRIETVRTLSRARTGGTLAVCSSLDHDLDLFPDLRLQFHEEITSTGAVKIQKTGAHRAV